MKTTGKIIASVFAVGALGMGASVVAAEYSFSMEGSGPYTIQAYTHYNFNFDVGGLEGDITKVTLTFTDFAGNNMGHCRFDLKAGDSAATGVPSITLTDATAPANPNGTFVFDDDAFEMISGSASPTGGTYRPIQSLAVFNGLTSAQANRTWSMYATAWNGDSSNHFDEATLTITTNAIPEPSAASLAAGIAALGFIGCRRRRAASGAHAVG